MKHSLALPPAAHRSRRPAACKQDSARRRQCRGLMRLGPRRRRTHPKRLQQIHKRLPWIPTIMGLIFRCCDEDFLHGGTLLLDQSHRSIT